MRQRRFQPVVRLEFASGSNSEIRESLAARFELRDSDVYELPDMLDYSGLFQIASLPIPGLRDPAWTPLPPLGIDADSDIFSAIRAGDVLVHHPYESFDASVERFIRDAADDPGTTTIKMTVYRLGDDTPFVRSLIKAAENGKQVACLVELKARFDEERNLHWAEELQKAGDHVIYGMRGPQDAHQAGAGRAPRGRRPAQLRPHRHRQLPRQDRAHVHRLRPVHLRPGADARRGHAVPPPDRVLARAAVRQAAGRAAQHAHALRRADRARSRQRARRPAVADRRQGQPARGRADLRGALRRVERRRADRPDRARILLPASRASRGSPRTCACARSSAGSSSTDDCSTSPTAARIRSTATSCSARPTGWTAISRVASRPSRRSRAGTCKERLWEVAAVAAGRPAQCLADAARRQLRAVHVRTAAHPRPRAKART